MGFRHLNLFKQCCVLNFSMSLSSCIVWQQFLVSVRTLSPQGFSVAPNWYKGFPVARMSSSPGFVLEAKWFFIMASLSHSVLFRIVLYHYTYSPCLPSSFLPINVSILLLLLFSYKDTKIELIWRDIHTENRQIITVITFSGGIYIFNSARLLINYYSNCTFPLNEIWLSVLIRLLRLPYFFCHKVSWNIG